MAITAAHSSSLGRECPFVGANLAFPIKNPILTLLSEKRVFREATAPIAFSEASEKICISVLVALGN